MWFAQQTATIGVHPISGTLVTVFAFAVLVSALSTARSETDGSYVKYRDSDPDVSGDSVHMLMAQLRNIAQPTAESDYQQVLFRSSPIVEERLMHTSWEKVAIALDQSKLAAEEPPDIRWQDENLDLAALIKRQERPLSSTGSVNIVGVTFGQTLYLRKRRYLVETNLPLGSQTEKQGDLYVEIITKQGNVHLNTEADFVAHPLMVINHEMPYEQVLKADYYPFSSVVGVILQHNATKIAGDVYPQLARIEIRFERTKQGWIHGALPLPGFRLWVLFAQGKPPDATRKRSPTLELVFFVPVILKGSPTKSVMSQKNGNRDLERSTWNNVDLAKPIFLEYIQRGIDSSTEDQFTPELLRSGTKWGAP